MVQFLSLTSSVAALLLVSMGINNVAAGTTCTVAKNGTDDTAAITSAFKTCKNGGTVVFSKGTTYNLNEILILNDLKNVDIELAGTIKLPGYVKSFKGLKSYIQLLGTDIHIYGGGVINGNGQDWYDAQDHTAPTVLRISSDNTVLENISIINSPRAHLGVTNATNVLINNITLHTASTSDLPPKNTDALDVSRSSNVVFQNSHLTVGDDCLAINEAVARLGCYQLGLSSPEFLPLLKFAVRAETVADACVVIMLDWSRPWKFLETLRGWISVLRYLTDEICKENSMGQWSQGKAVMDELKENLEHYLQTYTEPTQHTIVMTASTSTSSIATTSTPNINATSHADQVVLPLTTGCLTTNVGLPVIIVCSKSDAMNTLEQTHDYKEDQFDYIQQTLRSICMKYGAALFYTSSYQPYTYHHLREYILHRLLSNQNGKTYPFHAKAQVVERDTVFVPSGWDSWGKIKVLREGFDCESISEGWDENIEALADGHKHSTGAMGIYQDAIPNQESTIQPEHISVVTVCEDEQAFYERHFETLQKAQEPSRKPSRPVLPPSPRIDTPKPATHAAPPQAPQPTIDGQNGPSHEAIASFFASLLKKKDSGSASPTSSPTSLLNGLPPPTNAQSELHISVNREDVTKELDKMRQYTASK
ncbi:hypothetical protein G6F56_005455 [Rhizopus delemar]|nr:hypothetical protein G6F56_005455 [Rhizopus delemar]